MDSEQPHPFLHLLRHNMKSHSYLQHWPLFLLPGTICKNYKQLTNDLVEFLGGQFFELFEQGMGGRWPEISDSCHWKQRRFEVGEQNRKFDEELRTKGACYRCGSLPPLYGRQCSDSCRRFRGMSMLGMQLLFKKGRGHPRTCLPYTLCHTTITNQNGFTNTTHSTRCVLVCIEILWVARYFWWMKVEVLRCRLIPKQLEIAMVTLSVAEIHQTFAALRSFSTALFNYKNASSYVWANVKGSDVMLLCKWMQQLQLVFRWKRTIVSERKSWWSSSRHHGWPHNFWSYSTPTGFFLTRPCGANYMRRSGLSSRYTFLASYSMNAGLCLYSVKPKMHFQKHILLEVYATPECVQAFVNPVIWDCSQNEDLIGKFCKLGRQVDTRVLTQRTFEFFLIKAAMLLKAICQSTRILIAKRMRKGKGWCICGMMNVV